MQLDYYSSKFEKNQFAIILVTDNVIRPANVGSIFRIADAFGVEKLILGGSTIELNRKVWNTSRATEKVVNFEQIENSENVIKNLKKEGYSVICLEITKDSKSISEIQLEYNHKIVLVVGSERYGIKHEILTCADSIYHIPMYGQNSSMNVAQATSIALYEITKLLSNA
jgi:tRNA G18 (ribose-2'-O)-methylase SpoU